MIKPEFFIKQIGFATSKKAVDKILNDKAVQSLSSEDKARVDKAGVEKKKRIVG